MSGSNSNHPHIFSLYSHPSIYTTISLPSYTQYIWTGYRRCLSAVLGAPENDDQVNSEIHCAPVIERVWRCNWRSRLSELRDALGGHDQACLEMHLEAEVE
jgi:hypothetical protein